MSLLLLNDARTLNWFLLISLNLRWYLQEDLHDSQLLHNNEITSSDSKERMKTLQFQESPFAMQTQRMFTMILQQSPMLKVIHQTKETALLYNPHTITDRSVHSGSNQAPWDSRRISCDSRVADAERRSSPTRTHEAPSLVSLSL